MIVSWCLNRITSESVRHWHGELSQSRLSDVTVAKVYRLLRTILTTATEDGRLSVNPCQITKAGIERSPERPIPTVASVQAIAEALPARFAAVPWVAALAGLRKGEIFALARCHIDLTTSTIRVERSLQEIRGQGIQFVAPKTVSSVRTVSIPVMLADILRDHLNVHVGPDPLDLVFSNSRGSPVRASVWTPAWAKAVATSGRDVRLHDLRHLAGTLTAQAGATLKETMARLGHSTPDAALRYQPFAASRPETIAAGINALARS
jgi:integrase